MYLLSGLAKAINKVANSKRKCAHCKERKPVGAMLIKEPQAFCNIDHWIEYKVSSIPKAKIKQAKLKESEVKARHKKKLKELRTRTEWYNLLQVEVNKHVRLRDINEPCCTCGTTNPAIKYDAGHCFTRAARPDLRFNLTNIHKQCSVKCNQHGSGMRHEYQLFITSKYGPNHFEWLNSYHRPLSKEFPHWSDIEKEIQRYRKLNKLMINATG